MAPQAIQDQEELVRIVSPIAEGRADPPRTVSEPVDLNAVAEIKDEAGDIVSTVTVLWRLAPRPNLDERSVELGVAPPT